jgi:hypothetical protein
MDPVTATLITAMISAATSITQAWLLRNRIRVRPGRGDDVAGDDRDT